MSKSNARTLQSAMHVVGTEERLAVVLRVSVEDLRRWLTNEGDAPVRVILDALDVIETGHVRRRK